jgi:hydrogenase nickel incorporation protein HypA/HybF
MHELGVVKSILANALQSAQEANAARVADLYLVLGEFSSLDEDSIQFYWDEVSAGTICEDARLHFRRVPATLRCLDCDVTYTLDRDQTACPACGGEHVRLIAGDEVSLDHLDVETQDEMPAGQAPAA